MEVTVQGFPSDGTANNRFAVLPIEKHHVAPANRTLHGRRKGYVVLLKSPFHAADDKSRERMDVHLDARTVQCAQIGLTINDANHGPGIAARSQHDIH